MLENPKALGRNPWNWPKPRARHDHSVSRQLSIWDGFSKPRYRQKTLFNSELWVERETIRKRKGSKTRKGKRRRTEKMMFGSGYFFLSPWPHQIPAFWFPSERLMSGPASDCQGIKALRPSPQFPLASTHRPTSFLIHRLSSFLAV